MSEQNDDVWLRGTQLTAEQVAEALTRCTNRDTVQSPWTQRARVLAYSTRMHVPTDAEWLASHEFVFTMDGSLIRCRPLDA